MPDLNDERLDELLSTVSAPELPGGMSQRIMAALSTAPAPTGLRGFLSSIFGTEKLTLPACGALASLLFGVTVGYMALPSLGNDTLAANEPYLEAFNNDNWDTSFEAIIQ